MDRDSTVKRTLLYCNRAGVKQVSLFQTTESDNRALKLAISDMQEKLSRQVGINENMKADMRLLKSSLTRQVVDLKKAEDKLGELLTNPSS